MAFGFKMKKFVTKKEYTPEELFEAIKDHEFTPGKPMWVKHAFTNIICFPEVDRQNQVQLLPAFMAGNGKSGTFRRQRLPEQKTWLKMRLSDL